jgi:flagellar basal body-associated protein FliL
MAAASPRENPPTPNTGLIVFVVLAAALTIAGVWFLGGRKSEAVPTDSGTVKSTLHLETFVLNLADPGQRSYLRVGIDLGLGREKLKGGEEPVAQVRDAILSVLDQARVDEILTASGKAKLKAEVLRALQERVPSLAVKEVYFTEFLIQR